MKSLTHQTDAELGGPLSVLVRQRTDHARLDRLLDEVLTTSGRERDRALRAVARLIFPHAFAEGLVLWPELRRCLPEGRVLASRVESGHRQVNELWRRLESKEVTESERQDVVEALAAVLREDVRDEEEVLLPRLQESVDLARLRRLGVAWELVRRLAPTRPHPVATRRPVRLLTALPLAVLDRGRDGVDAVAQHRARWNVPFVLGGARHA